MSFRRRLYWHIHHDKLSEFNTSPISERKTYIKQRKPRSEIATRVRLLRPVQTTPEIDEIIKFLVKNNHNYYYDYYYYSYYYHTYYLKLDVDRQIYIYLIVILYQLVEALHNEQCPNCPWNGKEIDFSKVGI